MPNDPLQYLFRRRSVRAFAEHKITDEELHALLEAAMCAPSACGRDPWEFVVLREKSDLRLAASALPNGPFLADASAGILVCGDPRNAHAGELSYLLQDCAAAIENILLAAPALGLGGCWLGVHPRSERLAALQQAFGLPPDLLVIGAVAIGLPAKAPEPRCRFRQEKIHAGRWGVRAAIE